MSETQDFWSRRRAAVAAEDAVSARDASEAATIAARAEVEVEAEEKSDATILAELGLTDPDEMKSGDDFKAFLQDAVPERLRRRALRALWRSNPVLANVDNLVDYGEDFTDSATVVENLQTAYQVGKGMLRHVEAMAAKAEAEAQNTAATEGEDEVVAVAEPEVDIATLEGATDLEADRVSYDQSPNGSEAAPEEPIVRKRMHFDYPVEIEKGLV